MSKIYDNWERLVAAVLKREEFLQLCLDHSTDSSITSMSSDYNTLGSWIALYEPSVYVLFKDKGNRTRDITGVFFSSAIFNEDRAEAWWLRNRKKVYERYSCQQAGLIRINQLSDSIIPGSSLTSAKAEFQEPARQIVNEWTKMFEPGVFITILDLVHETTGISMVQFSGKKFSKEAAKAWWSNNREIVYEIHNAQARLSPDRQQAVSSQVPSCFKGAHATRRIIHPSSYKNRPTNIFTRIKNV